MNKNRRKQLEDICRKLEELNDKLDSILSDEQDYFDNMPENLQNSMRGSDSEEAIDLMEEAIGSIEVAIDTINEII